MSTSQGGVKLVSEDRPAKVGVKPSRSTMSLESIQSFLVVALGFAVAGMISTGYQLLTHRPPSFRLLDGGAGPQTFAAVPFLAFAAPFIIMRNTLRGRRIARRRFEFVMLATITAAFWSMMSGTILVMGLEAMERLFV
jgi:O-antigen/teichoic acid export membrane protein